MEILETAKKLVSVIESVSEIKFAEAIKNDDYAAYFAVRMSNASATSSLIQSLLKCSLLALYDLQCHYHYNQNNKTIKKLEKSWKQQNYY